MTTVAIRRHLILKMLHIVGRAWSVRVALPLISAPLHASTTHGGLPHYRTAVAQEHHDIVAAGTYLSKLV